MQAVCQGNSLNRRLSPPKKLLRFQEILSLQKTERASLPSGRAGATGEDAEDVVRMERDIRECGRTARLTVALNAGL